MEPSPEAPRRPWSVWGRVIGFVRPYLPRLAVYYAIIVVDAAQSAVQPVLLIFLLKAIKADELFRGARSETIERHYQRFLQWTGIYGNRDPRDAPLFAVLILVLAAIGIVSVWFVTYFEGHFTWRILIDIRRRVWEHLIRLPLSFHDRRRSGDVLSRMTNDLQQMQKGVSQLYGDFLVEPPKLAGVLITGMLIDWRVSIFVFIVFPLVGGVFILLGRRVKKHTKRRLKKQGILTDTMSQTLAGIREIKGFGLEGHKMGEMVRTDEGILRDVRRMLRAKGWMKGLVEGVSILLPGIGILLFGYVAPLPLEIVALYAIWTRQAYGSIRKLADAVNVLQEASPAAHRVFGLVDENPLEADPPSAVEVPRDVRRVAVEGLEFSYDGATPVLRGISFEASRGQVIAVVGPTGAGKTTLLDLLARFYRPTAGAVRFDGTDIQTIRRKSLASLLAIVGQEPFLFNTSIRENIACGRPGATEPEILAAARAAHVDEFLERLPGGLDYAVGERGDSLSGGQRQRVTIARAFLKDAPILLLDEATSSLDAGSERHVQEALGDLMKGRLTFVIAHRLSTIQHADRILVLEEGRLCDQGTHAELVGRGDGFYRRAYEWQVGAAGRPAPIPAADESARAAS